MCHAWNTHGTVSRSVLLVTRLHYMWNYLTCVTESHLMDEHVQWVDMQPNHTQTIFGELTMHNLCMTYSVSMQVPQSCTATKLHITLLLMHTTTILHGPNDLTMILVRSSQDLPNIQDQGQDPQRWDLSVQFYICGTQT